MQISQYPSPLPQVLIWEFGGRSNDTHFNRHPADPKALVLRPDTLSKPCSELLGGGGPNADLALTVQRRQR